jgi:hypothetical protein
MKKKTLSKKKKDIPLEARHTGPIPYRVPVPRPCPALAPSGRTPDTGRGGVS